ncbi:hypothetical protein [Brevibacillus sp. 179-C9.3 HS]|uniref:hypothetical protein n=1 Tax=unclassified Brevibacillus TaxID=2684853 RepID=UPI0039A34049
MHANQLSFFEDSQPVRSIERGQECPAPSILGSLSESILAIIARLREAYLDPSHQHPWIVATSFGKDSTLQCVLIWLMLQTIPPVSRTRKVVFLTSDTGLEHPIMQNYVKTSIDRIIQAAKVQGLPNVEAHLVLPELKERFGPKVIGAGVPMSTPKSPFRWCTDRWKIKPVNQFIQKYWENFGGVIVFLAVRSDESILRAKNIKKHKHGQDFIYQKAEIKKDNRSGREIRKTIPGKYECTPIVDVTDEELWDTLMLFTKFPWGGRFSELYALYKDSGECPMQVSGMGSSCGSNRNGCVICLFPKDDGMLAYFKERGEVWADPILELRKRIKAINYDANYRLPIRKSRVRTLDQRDPFAIDQYSLFEQGIPIIQPLVQDSRPLYPDLALASFTLEARIFLLKNTLYFQQLAGVELVTEEDITYIKKRWHEEFGWVENDEDLRPEPLEHFGTLILDEHYEVNLKESTIPNLVVCPTGKREEIERGIRYNPDPAKEIHPVFYVTIDQGCSERELYHDLMIIHNQTRRTIPVYWASIGKEEQGTTTFWNQLTFVVCQPGIQTYEQAISYVEQYLSHRDKEIPDERPRQRIIDAKFLQRSSQQARIDLLMHPIPLSFLSPQIKDHTGITPDELEMARWIVGSRGSASWDRVSLPVATQRCEDNIELWFNWFFDVTEVMDKEEAKTYLLKEGFHPDIVPGVIKKQVRLSDWDLLWGYKLAFYGERDTLTTLMVLPHYHDRLPLYLQQRLSDFTKQLSLSGCLYLERNE